MIRGVSFQIPQTCENTLWKILNNTLAEGYIWHINKTQTEVWDESGENDLFQCESYEAKDFAEIIHRDHFIVFLKMQVYDADTVAVNIESYNDFLQSDCLMVVLIYDCEYVEIYSKREDVTDAIYKNILTNGYESIEYLTDKNDFRTDMNVL